MANQKQSVSPLSRELTGDMPEGSPQFDPDHKAAADTPAGETPPGGPASSPGEGKAAGSGKKSKGEIDPDQWSHLKDKFGFKFDPALHEVKKDNTPKLSKNGLLCRKPGRTKTKTRSRVFTGPQPAGEGAAAPEAMPGTEAHHYAAAGNAMAQTIFAIGVALGGEEWQPAKNEALGLNESDQMAAAWADYFRAKGVVDIPPGMAVGIACASYALPRLAMPKTRGRLGRLVDWFKRRKGKRREEVPAGDKGEKETA